MDSERHYIRHAALQIRSLRDIATITSFSKMNSRRTDDNTTYKEPLFFFFFLILPWVFQHGGNRIDSYCEIRTKNLAFTTGVSLRTHSHRKMDKKPLLLRIIPKLPKET